VGLFAIPQPAQGLMALASEVVKNSMVGTRCCASAMINPTRTRTTASLPNWAYKPNAPSTRR